MMYLFKIKTKTILYIFFLILFLLIITANKSFSNNTGFEVNNLEVSEDFDLKFSKDKVIEKAFKKGFNQLLFKILTFKDYNKIKKTNINEIKPLIENFKIKDEKFQDSKYFANFEIKFNKKKIFNFLEKKNVFVSIPLSLDVVFLPIIIDNENFKIFNDNLFYLNWYPSNKKKYLLNYILPLEDIYDFDKLVKNSKNIENFDMVKFSEKYNSKNFILSLIYKNKNELNIFSKIKFKEKLINSNLVINNVNLDNPLLLQSYIENLKIHYEDIWKKQNEINTSIKLSLEIVLNSKDFVKIENFENTLNNIYLINSFSIKKFNLEKNVYEIIYNGDPSTLMDKFKENNIILFYDNNRWIVK